MLSFCIRCSSSKAVPDNGRSSPARNPVHSIPVTASAVCHPPRSSDADDVLPDTPSERGISFRLSTVSPSYTHDPAEIADSPRARAHTRPHTPSDIASSELSVRSWRSRTPPADYDLFLPLSPINTTSNTPRASRTPARPRQYFFSPSAPSSSSDPYPLVQTGLSPHSASSFRSGSFSPEAVKWLRHGIRGASLIPSITSPGPDVRPTTPDTPTPIGNPTLVAQSSRSYNMTMSVPLSPSSPSIPTRARSTSSSSFTFTTFALKGTSPSLHTDGLYSPPVSLTRATLPPTTIAPPSTFPTPSSPGNLFPLHRDLLLIVICAVCNVGPSRSASRRAAYRSRSPLCIRPAPKIIPRPRVLPPLIDWDPLEPPIPWSTREEDAHALALMRQADTLIEQLRQEGHQPGEELTS